MVWGVTVPTPVVVAAVALLLNYLLHSQKLREMSVEEGRGRIDRTATAGADGLK